MSSLLTFDDRADQMNAGRCEVPASRHVHARRAAAYIAWILISAAFLRPLLNTTIVADDFINPFVQFSQAGPSVWSNLSHAHEAVERSGHFNYLGQYVGALYNQMWLLAASRTGLSLAFLYAVTKLVVFLATALAVAAYVRRTAEHLGRPVTAWQARSVVSLFLFGTLQLHVAWGSDPVASFPLSGYASAALGFALLTVSLVLTNGRRSWTPWTLGVLGAATILYYEINVAAVASCSLVLLYRVLEHPVDRLRRAAHLSPAVAVPALVTLALQLRDTPNSANYAGTELSLGSEFLTTTWIAVLSSLPAGGWALSSGFIGGHPQLLPYPLLVLCVVIIAVWLLARSRGLPSCSVKVGEWRWLLLVAPLAYGLGAIVIQASTAKVQDELTRVGVVYNFYAISATAVATALALAVLLAPRAARRPAVAAPALVGAGAFLLVQVMVNSSISVQFNSTVLLQNRMLLMAFEQQLPPSERCSAVAAWASLGLPENYKEPMVQGLQDSYQHFYGDNFCPGFVRQ